MRGQSGMTLLEVLVALMLMALTGMLLSEGLSFGTRIWERAGAGAGAAVTRADAMATLRRLVEQAEPPGPVDDGDGFAGGSEGLAFITHEGSRLAGGIGRRVELYQTPGGGAVRLRITPLYGDGVPDDLPMLGGVAVMRLRYFGQDEVNNVGGWTDRWEGQAALPVLVEMTVTYADGGPDSVLRAAPRRQTSVECLTLGGRGCTGQRP